MTELKNKYGIAGYKKSIFTKVHETKCDDDNGLPIVEGYMDTTYTSDYVDNVRKVGDEMLHIGLERLYTNLLSALLRGYKQDIRCVIVDGAILFNWFPYKTLNIQYWLENRESKINEIKLPTCEKKQLSQIYEDNDKYEKFIRECREDIVDFDSYILFYTIYNWGGYDKICKTIIFKSKISDKGQEYGITWWFKNI